MVEFRARLPSSLDQAMTLFTLRRLRASGEFVTASGASDMEMIGEVPEERLDELVQALRDYKGAIHAGDRHIAIDKAISEHPDIRSAEAHLGGPYTVPGATRAVWAHGDDVRDHIVQALYEGEDRMNMRAIIEATARPPAHIMKAMQRLTEDGHVRKFRKPGDTSPTGEEFGLARTTRDHIARLIKPVTVADEADAPAEATGEEE